MLKRFRRSWHLIEQVEVDSYIKISDAFIGAGVNIQNTPFRFFISLRIVPTALTFLVSNNQSSVNEIIGLFFRFHVSGIML